MRLNLGPIHITERQRHPTQDFRVRADGRVEMRVETTGCKELALLNTACYILS